MPRIGSRRLSKPRLARARKTRAAIVRGHGDEGPTAASAARAVSASVRLARPFRPQPAPIFQPLADLALEAAIARPVELFPRHAIWKIVLTRERLFCLVVVVVAGAVTQV